MQSRRFRTAAAVALTALALSGAGSAARADEGPEIVGLELGFGGSFKLGCWTEATVTLRGGDKPLTGALQITAEDADGVPAATLSPPSRAVGVEPGVETTARVMVRPGKSTGSVTVRLLVDSRAAATQTFRPGVEPGPGHIRYGLAATSELYVLLGPAAGISDLMRSNRSDNEAVTATLTHLDSVAQLPLDWAAYEGVETVVMTTSQPEIYRPLAQNPQRVDALLQWIEQGGRVVLFCGREAEELLEADGPLAPLVPGDFAGMAPLRETAPLENFIVTDDPLNRGRIDIRVPRIDNPQGEVLARAGRGERVLPLVIRARRGLGQITFVGVDPDLPPLADWSARSAFLRRAIGLRTRTAADDQADAAAMSGGGYVDLSNQLRGALDDKFVGVSPAPFGLVALLVVGYIALIGPGDYFFVKRVLKRMELTWITFPAVVIATSAGAYWLANSYKGDQLRVNTVEIVDVDVQRGVARGTVWSHLFNPRVQRFNFALAAQYNGAAPEAAETLVSWLGQAGSDLGGMQGQASQGLDLRPSYVFAPDLASLLGVPVPEWSTKTLAARWRGGVEPGIDADLTATDDDLLAGTITNQTGVTWHDGVVMHGRWAYRLSRLEPQAVATLDVDSRPTTIKTRLTAASAGEEAAIATGDDGTVAFDPQAGDVTRLVKLMMFYDAIGGPAYASTLNRYQSFVDLSDLLAGDQAIVLVRVDATGSQWRRDGVPLGSDDDRRWVFYRYVIPLAKPDAPDE